MDTTTEKNEDRPMTGPTGDVTRVRPDALRLISFEVSNALRRALMRSWGEGCDGKAVLELARQLTNFGHALLSLDAAMTTSESER